MLIIELEIPTNMFLNKTKIINSDFFDGFVDYHSHILPAVDDGMKNMEETLGTLHYYEQIGVKKVILTPHINAQYNCNHTLQVKQFNLLLQLYKGTIELHLAAEYMLDAGFKAQITDGLRTVSDTRVLVETSYAAAPNNFYELLYELASTGHIPLIAHPERYVYMNKNDYFKLKDKGYEFQLNLLSLSGVYGKMVKDNANYLLENNIYNFAGTDIHSLSSFKERIENMRLKKKQLSFLTQIKYNKQ